MVSAWEVGTVEAAGTADGSRTYINKKDKERNIMELTDYLKPELISVAVVLYFLGMWTKQSETIKDKYIPLINGIVGIVICGIYVFATCDCLTPQHAAMAAFTSITQGILVAGLSTYVNQVVKQRGKEE